MPGRPGHLVRVFGAALGAILLAAALGGCPRKAPSPVAPETPAPTPVPLPTPPPPPTPPPTPYVPMKRLDVGKIFNGFQLKTSLETDHGAFATETREDPASYTAEIQIHVKVPKPNADLAALAKRNPQLPTVLPQLPLLLNNAKVSPFYDDLYRLKVSNLQQNLMHLDGMLSRHNFYDCETVLQLEHPLSKRRAILLQADMDTDNDGSDADRVPDVDGTSVTFQPFTSYRWAKKTQNPNSFVIPRTNRLKQIDDDLTAPGLPAAKAQQLKNQEAEIKTEISDLKKYSFLVGSIDPYVVIPGSMLRHQYGGYRPNVGDFCVVIYNDTLYPSVIGDVGPPDLVGEASLRICRQISPRADANNRPVNDLTATYLIFPETAERPFDAPNLAHWRDRCEKLLNELGGYAGTLYTWEDLAKPKPPPATPAPATPAPSLPTAATPPPSAASNPAPAAPQATPAPATPAPAPAH